MACCYEDRTLKISSMSKIIAIFSLLLITLGFSSCAVIGVIFKAGVWVGVLIVVAIIALILFVISRGSNKK